MRTVEARRKHPVADPVSCGESPLVDPAIQNCAKNSDDFFGDDVKAKKLLIGQGSTSGAMSIDVSHTALQKSRFACLKTPRLVIGKGASSLRLEVPPEAAQLCLRSDIGCA